MNLREFLECKLNVKFETIDITGKKWILNEKEIINFCSYAYILIYDLNEFKNELVEFEACDDRLMDFINDWSGVADYFNYTMINENMFVDNISIYNFEKMMKDYDNGFEEVLKDWGMYYQGGIYEESN